MKQKFGYIMQAFFVLVLSCFIPYLVRFIDLMVLFLRGIFSTENRSTYTLGEVLNQDYNQPMNLAYIMAFQYLLYIICFGLWYYRRLMKQKVKFYPVKKVLFSPITYLLIVAGYAGQLMVDSVLNICSSYFPAAFEEYNSMIESTVGAGSSVVMLVAVFVFAPIGEELLFRGLLQEYLKRLCGEGAKPAIFIMAQAILFGVYHGNVIQCAYAFVLGCVLGYIAYRFDSLLPGMLLHMMLNISVCFAPTNWFEFTERCIIIGIVSALVFAAAIFLIMKIHSKTLDNSNDTEKN